MSGICGIVNLDGATADPGQLALMTERLERRGPDGTHRWQKGPTGIF